LKKYILLTAASRAHNSNIEYLMGTDSASEAKAQLAILNPNFDQTSDRHIAYAAIEKRTTPTDRGTTYETLLMKVGDGKWHPVKDQNPINRKNATRINDLLNILEEYKKPKPQTDQNQ